MSDTPQLLLAHHLKALKLPTVLREYDKQARQCAAEGVDHVRYLVRLTELELIDRERRMVERRIRMAKFPAVKSLDSFDFKAMPSLNKMMVLELARCEYIERRENVIALGNSGTGKTHIALGLGLAACQKGLTVGFITAAALVHELIEARDEKRLLRFQKQLAKYKLLIIDELGFVPLSKTGAELLFEVFSQRYEGGSTLVTSNLPFDEWTEVFGSERLTGALLDRLTHHVHFQDMDMVGEPVQQSPSQAFRAEYLRPLIERQGGGHQDRAPLVALAEDFEQQLGAGLRERHEAAFVDDQKVILCQLLLQAQQAFFIPGLHQFMNQGSGREDADGEPLLAGRQTETEGDMGLAGSAVAERDCQRRSKISPPGRSKTSPLNVMRYAVLGGCPGSP